MATILEQKSQIDKLWETFWSNGISNPLTVIEQISYLFFIKELDEKHTREERKANRLNRPIENPVFDETPKQQNIRWSKFKDCIKLFKKMYFRLLKIWVAKILPSI